MRVEREAATVALKAAVTAAKAGEAGGLADALSRARSAGVKKEQLAEAVALETEIEAEKVREEEERFASL